MALQSHGPAPSALQAPASRRETQRFFHLSTFHLWLQTGRGRKGGIVFLVLSPPSRHHLPAISLFPHLENSTDITYFRGLV